MQNDHSEFTHLRRGDWLAIALVAFGIVVIGLALKPDGYLLRIATLILMFAGMSGAWNLISGYANQISLGHAAFFGVGAYLSTLLFVHYGISPWLGMLAAAAAGAVLSVVIGLPTFRLRGHYYALATFAVAELLRVLALYFRDFTNGASGLSLPFVPHPSFWTFQYSGNRPYFAIAALMFAVVIAVSFWLERGALGYRLRALRDSHEAAEVVGVDTARAKLHASLISGALMAVFGTLYAQYQLFIDPDTVFGFWTISGKVAMIVILGGVATVWGPLLGAIVLIALDEWTGAIFTGNLAALSRLIYALILIGLIIYRPGGLMSLINAGIARFRRTDAQNGTTVSLEEK